MIQIRAFPKICHLHKVPMEWKDGQNNLRSGWSCPNCTVMCKIHDAQMRSGFGKLYCRLCRVTQIREATATRRGIIRDNPALFEDLRKASGVSWTWRAPQ